MNECAFKILRFSDAVKMQNSKAFVFLRFVLGPLEIFDGNCKA